MGRHSNAEWQHRHDFLPDFGRAERGTRLVLWLTAATMVAEIVGGLLSNSMALLADGWHMATHVAAFGMSIFAYRYARRHADDARFAFGTGKVATLGGFASAVALAVIALVMALESIARWFEPRAIHFDSALAIAALGLAVNVVCGIILGRHAHDDAHEHGQHHDHNLRAAYMHVLADALTSVLAIGALLAGRFFGVDWLDAAVGVIGALVIARWSYALARQSGAVLLDGADHGSTSLAIRDRIERESMDEVTDLHVWRVSPTHLAATVAVVTHSGRDAAHYRRLIEAIPELSHVVVEVNLCRDAACLAQAADSNGR